MIRTKKDYGRGLSNWLGAHSWQTLLEITQHTSGGCRQQVND
jgi:hypothetical protein